MKQIIKAAAAHPWPVIAAIGLLSLIAMSQIPGLRILVTAESMLERGTPAWNYFVSTEETFGAEDVIVVVLRDPDIFDRDKLVAVRYLVRELAGLPGVSSTASLFDAKNVKNVDDTIFVKPYLEQLPDTPGAAAQIVTDAVRDPLALGNLISSDGQTLAINVYYRQDDSDADFDQRMTAAVEALISPLRRQFSAVYQVGAAAIRSDLSAKMRADQKVFLPLSIVVLVLTLAFTLRRLNAAIIPLLTAGISVVWTLGFMAWFDIPVNIMTSIVPALVIIIGSTEDIHLLAEYAAGIRNGLDRPSAIARMADNMGVAVLLTFITTYLGFLSIALNDIQLLFEFGLVASTGLLFNFVITILLVPVVLGWRGHTSTRLSERQRRQGRLQSGAVALVLAAQRHRRSILITAGGIAIGAVLAATQLRINNNLLDFLDPQSDLRANLDRIHDELSGVHAFSVVVDSGIDNTFLQVKYLEQIRKIQEHIEQSPFVDRSFSFADIVALINAVMVGDGKAKPVLPDSDDVVREYMLFIKHRDVEGFVSENFGRARILVRHNIGSSSVLNEVIAELQGFVDANVDPALRVEITGKSVLSNRAVEKMAYGQLQSLLLVGGVIVVLVSALFVSVRAGLIALVPNLFPVAILFAVMALSGIPLNTGTSMVAAIALGICVDDTMHVMSRFHEELKRHDTREAALIAMVGAEAVPIVSTSIALAAGFAVFATSSFAPVAYFGLLSAMVIIVALGATFVLTPLLLGSTELLTVWDLLSYKIQQDALQKSQLFAGMYVWQIKKILLSSEIRRFASHERIITEGDSGAEMFVVLEGRVEACRRCRDGGVKHLRVMEVGELFGEVGPLSGGRRTADVVALGDTQVLVLSWERIDRLTRLYPMLAFRLFRNLTRIIGARLTQTSEYRLEDDASGDVRADGDGGPARS
ncbi:MAG: MMPL family transporter [Chromatiaceae bacterium]|nr:MMPL family transporter [Chromatiaceae bacterium]MCP5421653.1 MMPL family transporter [Chromatiaceae bacterium]